MRTQDITEARGNVIDPTRQVFGISIVSDHEIPPGEVHFKHADGSVSKIVNVGFSPIPFVPVPDPAAMKQWRETDLREILAEEYDKVGFNALAHSVRACSDVTRSVDVALAALKRVAGKAPR
jgi:hypothetical protein